eukprot:3272892-Pyramimonas_sp.AAC.1
MLRSIRAKVPIINETVDASRTFSLDGKRPYCHQCERLLERTAVALHVPISPDSRWSNSPCHLPSDSERRVGRCSA